MKDRMAAAGVPVDVAEYILGHTSQGASRLHQRYGTATPPEHLLDSITKACEVAGWGYFDD
jgi:hypothetical protein